MIMPSAICTLETFAHSEDQDEMQHNAAFNQGLHVLLRANQSSGTKIQND